MKKILIKAYVKIFARTTFLSWNRLLLKLSLKGLGVNNFQGSDISGEDHLIQFLYKNHKLNLIFDVGANKGQYALLFTNETRICSFEPNPLSYDLLKENLSRRTAVKTYPFGFSDRKGTALLYDRIDENGSQHASLYQEVIRQLHHTKANAIEIQLDTIDNFVQSNDIARISMLKIDTEGNELAVLQGARRSIEKGKIDIIHFEFNAANVISRAFMRDFYALLDQYHFYRLLPNGFLPLDFENERPYLLEIFHFQNIVAFRKDIDKLKQRKHLMIL